MRVYITGPMSNRPHWNYPQFDEAAAAWRESGHEVVTPADLDRANGIIEPHPTGDVSGVDYGACIRRCLEAVLGCDAVAVLPGWTESVGACIEVSVAVAIGLPVYWADGGANPLGEVSMLSRGRFTSLLNVSTLLHGAAAKRAKGGER